MKTILVSAVRGSFLPRIFFLLCAILLPSHMLHAQEKKSSPLIYCVAYAPNFSELFAKQAEDRYQSITLSTANIIELTDAPTVEGKLSLYGPADDAGNHPLAASADLAATAHPLIILKPAAAEAQPPYTATVIDANLALFPLGSYYLVNLSPHPIRITQGKEPVEVPSAGTHIYQPQNATDEPLAITIDYKLEEEWLLLSSSHWANRNDRRTLVCIVEDSVSKRMTIKSIPLRPTPRP